MLETAHHLIERVGHNLGLDDKTIQKLLKTDAEHEFEIKLSSGTTHKAYRVQHSNKLGPYKGGIRFHPEVDLEEVRALATLMSLKTSAVGLPLGGGKGGVAVNPKGMTKAQLEELSRHYAKHLAPHIGPDKDIPAPDVSTNSQIIDWMVDEYEKQTGDRSKASFTGKSIAKGGSHGRDAATGRGGVIVLRELLKLMNKNPDKLTYAVQGFGNVGSFFGVVASQEQANWKLTAASDSSGTIHLPAGLDAVELTEFKAGHKHFSDFKKAGVQHLAGEDLIGQDVDVLVMAALGDAINESNVKDVKAKIILELANGPVNEVAHGYLTNLGVVIVPDILANAGGVIVSYLEWLQNRANERWDEAKVNAQLASYLKKATKKIYDEHMSSQVSLKEAAFAVAIKRLLEGDK